MTARLRLRRGDGAVYLERWGIQIDWLGGILLHRMSAPDPGLDLHDHPWSFVSLILWGGYDEERASSAFACQLASRARKGYLRHRTWLSVRRTVRQHTHRIVALNKPTSWSLILHGPRRQEWGFYTPDGFVNHRDYQFRGLDLRDELYRP